MKALRWTAGFVAVIVVFLAAIPLFFSSDDWVPRIEKAASEKLGEKVTIGKIRLAGLPIPHATIGPVAVGTAPDVAIGEVVVTPDLFSLLGDVKRIRSVEVRDVDVAHAAFGKIPLWTGSRSPDGPVVRVSRIEVTNATIAFSAGKVGPLDASVSLNDEGMPSRVDAKSRDGKLTLGVIPQEGRYLIELAAKTWTPPVGPAVVFDALSIRGTATTTAADLREITATLYGGSVSGSMTGNWDKGARVKGDFSVKDVELERLVPLLSPGTRVSGRLTAKPVLSAGAREAGKLADALRVETPFNVVNGVLHGVDIAKAASVLLKEGSKGGETRFDTLTGHLLLEQGNYRLSALKISSGSLSAEGAVNISAKKELAGRINATVRAASIASATVPLNISGTLQSPSVLPSASYIAGAVAGTATMGPGIGTSVGSALGRMAEGLFGNNKDAKKKP